MAVVTFAAGDKDYIEKLNTMSQNAGDTAQLKADTQAIKEQTDQIKTDTTQLKADTTQLKADTQTIKNQAQAIAVGELNFESVNESKAIANGDRLQALTAGIEFTLAGFEAALSIGHWFTLANESNGLVYVKTTNTLSLKPDYGTIGNSDRLAISPGKKYTFRAISATQVRVQ